MSFSQHSMGICREQLEAMAKNPRASIKERQVVQVLLKHFVSLSRRGILGEFGACEFIHLEDLHEIMRMSADGKTLTYENMLLFRANNEPEGILMQDVNAVMQEISGQLWRHPVTYDQLKKYLDKPGLNRTEIHITRILMRHFTTFQHVDHAVGVAMITLSDVSHFAKGSNYQQKIVTLSALQEAISLQERLQIEVWLDNNGLDKNGIHLNQQRTVTDPLLGFLDRYDRLLFKFPERPWDKQSAVA